MSVRGIFMYILATQKNLYLPHYFFFKNSSLFLANFFASILHWETKIKESFPFSFLPFLAFFFTLAMVTPSMGSA